MPEIVYGQDDRMYGATGVAAARSDTRLILANPVLSKLVNVAFTGGAVNASSAQLLVQAASALLPVAPKVVTSSTNYIFAAGKNKLYRCPNSIALDTDGFAATAYTTEADNPLWIVEHDGFVFLPWNIGGVIIYDADDGSEILRMDGLLGETTLAAWDSTNDLLYLVDGKHARGVTLTLSGGIGVVEVGDEFALAGCKGATAVVPAETYLAVACENRLVLFSTVVPALPEFSGVLRTSYRLNHLVKVATNAWWIASDTYLENQADRFDYRNKLAIFIVGVGVFAISSTTGRVIGEADFNATTPDDVVDDDDGSFYILSDAGERITDDDGNPLVQEEAP